MSALFINIVLAKKKEIIHLFSLSSESDFSSGRGTTGKFILLFKLWILCIINRAGRAKIV